MLSQKLANDPLDAVRPAVASRELTELSDRGLQRLALGMRENAARQAIDVVAHVTAAQGIAPAPPAHLELEEQVEVTELERPPILQRERAHPAEIVDDERLHARREIGWERSEDGPPACRRFVPGQ